MTAYLVALVGALAVLALIVELLRRRQLKEKYAVLWLVVGSGTTLLALFPSLLVATADAIGVQVPANLLFFAALLMLLGVCVHLSWELSRVEDETRILAEEVALLRMDLDRVGPAQAGPTQAGPTRAGPARAVTAEAETEQTTPQQAGPQRAKPQQPAPRTARSRRPGGPAGEDERA